MTRLDPEQVDLAALAQHLRACLGSGVAGAVIGRTQLRDAVFDHLGCSQLEAEQLVDTLVLRGLLAREQLEGGVEGWVFRLR
jgi:hypothetical protein